MFEVIVMKQFSKLCLLSILMLVVCSVSLAAPRRHDDYRRYERPKVIVVQKKTVPHQYTRHRKPEPPRKKQVYYENRRYDDRRYNNRRYRNRRNDHRRPIIIVKTVIR